MVCFQPMSANNIVSVVSYSSAPKTLIACSMISVAASLELFIYFSVFRFWYYLRPYLPMHVSCSLPLSSTFCQGWGKRTYMHGQVNNLPYFNILHRCDLCILSSRDAISPKYQTMRIPDYADKLLFLIGDKVYKYIFSYQ